MNASGFEDSRVSVRSPMSYGWSYLCAHPYDQTRKSVL